MNLSTLASTTLTFVDQKHIVELSTFPPQISVTPKHPTPHSGPLWTGVGLPPIRWHSTTSMKSTNITYNFQCQCNSYINFVTLLHRSHTVCLETRLTESAKASWKHLPSTKSRTCILQNLLVPIIFSPISCRFLSAAVSASALISRSVDDILPRKRFSGNRKRSFGWHWKSLDISWSHHFKKNVNAFTVVNIPAPVWGTNWRGLLNFSLCF